MSFFIVGEISRDGIITASKPLAVTTTTDLASEWIGRQPDYENREFYIDGPCDNIVVLVSDGGWMR